MSRGRIAVAVLVLTSATLTTATIATANHRSRGPVIVVPAPVPAYGVYGTACWQDVRLFETLRDGYFPYCREHLRFRPGRLECWQITDRVCTTPDPFTFQVVESRRLAERQLIACPDGPVPPVCRQLDFTH